MPAVTTRSLGVINPDAVYTKKGSLIHSGLCEQKLNEAKREYHLEPKKFWVGKRCFIRGKDMITFLELLSQAEMQKHLQECRAEPLET